MRIIHVVPGLVDPDTVNGVNRVVHAHATTLLALGHDCEVWCVTKTDLRPRREPSYPLKVFPTSPFRFILNTQLLDAFNELPSDVWVQLHSVFVPELTAAAKHLKGRGLPYGVTPHGGYLSFSANSTWIGRLKKRLFLHFWEDALVRNASLIHAIGESELDALSKRYLIENRHILIPNGVDSVTLFNCETVQRESCRPHSLVYCGRLSIFQKGLDILLEGFALYRSRGGKMTLTMVGDGPDRKKLERIALRLNLADCIFWKGVLFGAALRQSLTDSDIFVHSSRFDGIPTACLEAAALSRPLLITRETNLGRAVQDWEAGWLVDPNSPDQWSKSLEILERMPSSIIRDTGKRAKEMVSADFSWPNLCRQFVAALPATSDLDVPLNKTQPAHEPKCVRMGIDT